MQETGCGKTTLIQHLAEMSGFDLVVQNLSLQTDSTDLLGGYRPLEMRVVARKVYTHFIELFVSTFSKKKNESFLNFVKTAFDKGLWKRLSQCFMRASQMGLNKVRFLIFFIFKIIKLITILILIILYSAKRNK